jgi:hypothetical protein
MRWQLVCEHRLEEGLIVIIPPARESASMRHENGYQLQHDFGKWDKSIRPTIALMSEPRRLSKVQLDKVQLDEVRVDRAPVGNVPVDKGAAVSSSAT